MVSSSGSKGTPMRPTSMAALTITAALCGCEWRPAPPPAPIPSGPSPIASTEKGREHEHSHDDGPLSQGPHHGLLVEIGKEEYHAEVLRDDATGTVTIYLLDGAAMAAVPTDATAIVISLLRKGKPAQFQLAPEADAADPAGKSSRFVLKNKELIEALDAQETTAQLSLTIEGVPFTASLPAGGHDHAAGGSDQDHEQK